ncbi:hypothetical protein B0T10DRAFT_606687 [Thelonectria olida]|uniref:Uncharacterized protein n=1 Tax=Thelonectria olida TaxID=1576542 RepID=A0A9P8W3I9_9HYPO|nr:hypothetical protein B0T10DRAFT_606687 [Thelonectria olida]
MPSFALTRLFTAVLAALPLVFTAPHPSPHNRCDAAASVYRFQEQVWIENLRVRSNGNVLTTRYDNFPRLYEFNPKDHHPLPRLLAEFPEYDNSKSLSGIAEYKPDVFAFLAGPSHYDLTAHALDLLDGTTDIWTIDLNVEDPRAQKLTSFQSGFANGISHVPGTPYGLVSDSTFGIVYRVNLDTGVVEKVVEDPLLHYPASAVLHIGINGIQLNEEGTIVYFANSQGFMGSFPIDPQTGLKTGDIKVLARLDGTVFDDFAVGKKALYITGDPEGEVFRLDLATNEITAIFGKPAPSHILPGATAAQLGRTRSTKEKLYLTYNGGLTVLPYNASFVIPGGLTVVDLAVLHA